VVGWKLKIAAKVVLTRLPVSYHQWRKIGIFRHGAMNRADYADGVLAQHLELAHGSQDLRGKSLLEVGPGDSLLSALGAFARGAKRIFLIDTGDYASADFSIYQQYCAYLAEKGYDMRTPSAAKSLPDLLERVSATYLCEGTSSLRAIGSGEIDHVFSQAVLEHIRKREFLELAGEIRRILGPTGVSSHVVDLRDHLESSLNNLRFSERFWEQDWFANSGFYTNRLRCSEILSIFRGTGLDVKLVSKDMWPALPLPISKMDASFRSIDLEELRVRTFTFVARMRGN
jgi:hypothetical protein